jgi:hypothetical protein
MPKSFNLVFAHPAKPDLHEINMVMEREPTTSVELIDSILAAIPEAQYLASKKHVMALQGRVTTKNLAAVRQLDKEMELKSVSFEGAASPYSVSVLNSLPDTWKEFLGPTSYKVEAVDRIHAEFLGLREIARQNGHPKQSLVSILVDMKDHDVMGCEQLPVETVSWSAPVVNDREGEECSSPRM